MFKQRKVFLITRLKAKTIIFKLCVWLALNLDLISRNKEFLLYRLVLTLQGGYCLKVVSKNTFLREDTPMNDTFMHQNLNRSILMQQVSAFFLDEGTKTFLKQFIKTGFNNTPMTLCCESSLSYAKFRPRLTSTGLIPSTVCAKETRQTSPIQAPVRCKIVQQPSRSPLISLIFFFFLFLSKKTPDCYIFFPTVNSN